MRTIFSFFIILITASLAEDFFYISYRSVLDNNILRTEKFHMSQAMIVPDKLKEVGQFSLEIEDEEEDVKVLSLFKQKQDEITKELFKSGIFVTNRSNVQKYSQSNKVVLTLPPTIISLSVKDNFVKITIYK